MSMRTVFICLLLILLMQTESIISASHSFNNAIQSRLIRKGLSELNIIDRSTESIIGDIDLKVLAINETKLLYIQHINRIDSVVSINFQIISASQIGSSRFSTLLEPAKVEFLFDLDLNHLIGFNIIINDDLVDSINAKSYRDIRKATPDIFGKIKGLPKTDNCHIVHALDSCVFYPPNAIVISGESVEFQVKEDSNSKTVWILTFWGLKHLIRPPQLVDDTTTRTTDIKETRFNARAIIDGETCQEISAFISSKL